MLYILNTYDAIGGNSGILKVKDGTSYTININKSGSGNLVRNISLLGYVRCTVTNIGSNTNAYVQTMPENGNYNIYSRSPIGAISAGQTTSAVVVLPWAPCNLSLSVNTLRLDKIQYSIDTSTTAMQ